MSVNNSINNSCLGGFTASGGTINISNDASSATVNVGTGGAAKTTTLGSTNSTSTTTVQSGSGGVSVNSHNGALSVVSGTGALSISADAAATTLSIGTGGAVKAVTVGSTTASSTTTIQAPSGGISLIGVDGYSVGSTAKVLTEGSNVIGTATITAGTGVTIGTSANTITVNAVGAGLTWNDVTGTSSAMAVNNGYIADNVALVTLTLPATAAQGSVISVAGKGAGGWTIAQNSGQTIHFGASNTTTGATGSLSSSLQYDGVSLLCVTANTDFVVLSAIGNLTVA